MLGSVVGGRKGTGKGDGCTHTTLSTSVCHESEMHWGIVCMTAVRK